MQQATFNNRKHLAVDITLVVNNCMHINSNPQCNATVNLSAKLVVQEMDYETIATYQFSLPIIH